MSQISQRKIDRASTSKGTFPKPRHALGPVAATIFSLLAWTGIAHSSGSGWVQAVGALLGGFLLVGLFAPFFAVRGIRVLVIESPSDAIVGEPITVKLKLSAPAEIRLLMSSNRAQILNPRTNIDLTVVPTFRGEVSHFLVEVASAFPFGLLWWTKLMVLTLPRSMLLAPKPGPLDKATLSAAGIDEEGIRWRDTRVGEPRGVRDYLPGDLRTWIHWSATAHVGSLMVREMEQASAPPVRIKAFLSGDVEQAERESSRFLGTIGYLLNSGHSVVLETLEIDGVHLEPVGDIVTAGRRLARSLPTRSDFDQSDKYRRVKRSLNVAVKDSNNLQDASFSKQNGYLQNTQASTVDIRDEITTLGRNYDVR